MKINNYYLHNLLFVITAVATAIIIIALSLSLSVVTTTTIAQSSNHNYYYYYYAGPISDPNDSMHVKGQQQAAENRWISNTCDKGHGNPLCYNVGYYSGVAEANFESTDNHNGTRVIILYSLVCPSPNTANFCAGYIQGYSHTYIGHIPNASEVWNAGYSIGDTNGGNIDINTPINGTNPASCNEGPAAFCDGYSQGYPHGIERALGSELGAKVADYDWNLKGSNSNPNTTTELVPPCPSGHTADWCDGWNNGYNDEWNILSDTD